MEKELKELKEKDEEQPVPFIPSYVQSTTESLSQAMSQVSLKALEINGLKKKIKELEYMAENKEKARNIL